jgi:hypothetical protein
MWAAKPGHADFSTINVPVIDIGPNMNPIAAAHHSIGNIRAQSGFIGSGHRKGAASHLIALISSHHTYQTIW